MSTAGDDAANDGAAGDDLRDLPTGRAAEKDQTGRVDAELDGVSAGGEGFLAAFMAGFVTQNLGKSS
mgnify:CR=1 FL=1